MSEHDIALVAQETMPVSVLTLVCVSAKRLSGLSLHPSEDEYVLMPGTKVGLTGRVVVNQAFMLHVKEHVMNHSRHPIPASSHLALRAPPSTAPGRAGTTNSVRARDADDSPQLTLRDAEPPHGQEGDRNDLTVEEPRSSRSIHNDESGGYVELAPCNGLADLAERTEAEEDGVRRQR